jgi:putative ABC transport system permease protein
MKEMGIRKAFGASTGRLLGSMASALLVWIAISAALGWSLAYFFTSDWLANFPFRIELRWWMFVASGLTVTVLAAMAVTGKILSLARVRPAHILRYE